MIGKALKLAKKVTSKNGSAKPAEKTYAETSKKFQPLKKAGATLNKAVTGRSAQKFEPLRSARRKRS